jgi:hypothetical protein
MRGAADRQWIRIRGGERVQSGTPSDPARPRPADDQRSGPLRALARPRTGLHRHLLGPARLRPLTAGLCLTALCLAGGPSGYGGDRRVGLVERLRCSGGWITPLGGLRQAMHERPGQRQGDSQQQPHPQAPGEKCPHAQGPFVVVLREVLRRYPPCPGLTTSRAAYYSSRT